MPRPLTDRIAVVESQVQMLQDLPGRMASLETRLASLESQFLQFRVEVKDEFLTTRKEVHAGDEETRRYMRVLHEDVIARIKVIGEK